ncbi:hypothetical protein D3C77_778990 [compost metagenome]
MITNLLALPARKLSISTLLFLITFESAASASALLRNVDAIGMFGSAISLALS